MSPESHGPAVERALLSAELRKLRADSGKTQEVVAAACEWSVAKFSRIENGTSSVRKADLEALLRYYEVDDDRITMLTERARAARAPGWWEDHDFGPDKGFEAYVGYEDGASTIRMWQPLVVPGLLQTPEYTVQTMRAWGVPEEAIQRGVELRAARQHRVAQRQPEQVYLLDEPVITRPVGTAMPEQLRYLIRIAGKPGVSIRIIPLKKGPHFGLRGPFVLLSFDGPLDDVLYLESARRGDLLIAETKDQYAGPNVPKVEDPADAVATYEDGFKDLLKLALEDDESLEFIKEQAAAQALGPSRDL
jgi:transcriptional regulator with XRE-family HTH domain